MPTLQVDHWQVECDAALTQAAYAQLAREAREPCDCACCRNFRHLGAEVFPDAAHALLRDLGIDYRHPAEVYVAGPAHEGRLSYGGWFHFAGRVIGERGDRLAELGAGFSYFLHERIGLVPAAFGQRPVVQLEFYVSAPWTLSEPHDQSSHGVV